jgi:hypothetical protein
VAVGTTADKARVGKVADALDNEFCQKRMPALIMIIKTKMMRTVRRKGRDEFTMRVPIK